MATTIAIDRHLTGPAHTAQGGIAAGLLASMLEGPARVRLHRPPPLQRPLQVQATDQGLQALAEDGLVMTAEPTTVEVIPPEVDLQAAQAASSVPEQHGAPTCVVCGPEHPHSLRIFPGVMPDAEVVATRWLPPA